MTVFQISIISDTVCPWCYIGSRRLQKAIMLYQKTYPGGSKDTFDITWKPYYLNPNSPKQGVPILEKMKSRMPADRVDQVLKHMQAIGTAEGISFNYGGKTGNSKLSHQLLQLAKQENLQMQNKVSEEIFRLEFEEERDITDLQTLVDAGVNCGLEEQSIRDWVGSEEAAMLVDKEVEEVNKMGIKGVPKFIIQDEQIEGASDAMDFFEVFMKIKEKAV